MSPQEGPGEIFPIIYYQKECNTLRVNVE
jgi:hypothetical protein